MNKKMGFLFVFAVFCLWAGGYLFAEQESQQAEGRFSPQPKPITSYVVFGPRLGFGGVFQDQAEFSKKIENIYQGGPYYPYYSVFGFNIEWRYLLGQSSDHFALQVLLTAMGVEQSILLPSAALLMGYRHHSGLEFGAGPLVNLGGMGVVVAVGYTLVTNGVYIPFDVAFQIPNYNFKPALTIMSGFNFSIE
jgi:hypothetical protein